MSNEAEVVQSNSIPRSQEPETATCERCQGNGEIVLDWEMYRHPISLEEEEKSVSECPDCDGAGRTIPAPRQEPETAKLIEVRNAALEEAAKVVEADKCGCCRHVAKAIRALARSQAAPLESEEELARLIEDELTTLNIGCGNEVNIRDAIASFRQEDSLSGSNDLINVFAHSCARAILDRLSPREEN